MFILLLKFAAWIAAGLLLLLVALYIAWKYKYPTYRDSKDLDLWSDHEQKNP